jgi:hypothetical protein
LPPGAQDAQRLLSHWPRSDVLVENYFSRLHDLRKAHGARFNRIRRGLYSARYKYIHSSDGAHELYDLERDPAELENLVEREPDLVLHHRAQRAKIGVAPCEQKPAAKSPCGQPSIPLDTIEIAIEPEDDGRYQQRKQGGGAVGQAGPLEPMIEGEQEAAAEGVDGHHQHGRPHAAP